MQKNDSEKKKRTQKTQSPSFCFFLSVIECVDGWIGMGLVRDERVVGGGCGGVCGCVFM